VFSEHVITQTTHTCCYLGNNTIEQSASSFCFFSGEVRGLASMECSRSLAWMSGCSSRRYWAAVAALMFLDAEPG
jgi:hypothetical protein